MAIYKNEILNQVVISGEDKIRQLEIKLEAADSAVERANAALQETEARCESLQEKFQQFAHESGLAILEDELERFRGTADTALSEVRAYLQSVNLNDAWGHNDHMFLDIFDDVKQGSLTASEAISRIKSEYRELIEQNYNQSGGLFDTQMVQQFIASLDTLGNEIGIVRQQVESIIRDGVSMSNGGGSTTNILEEIRSSIEGMSEDAKAAYQPVTQLIQCLSEYANLDGTKLLGVSQALRSISEIGQGRYGTKSIENIVYLIKQLQAAASSGAGVIRFDLTGLNELHVRKASLNNLATYLPQIAAVNAARLERLSKINLTNFNNVKVSKASMEAIAQLNEALRVLQQTRAASATTESGSINIDVVNKEVAAAENAAYKEYEAQKKAEEQKRAEIEKSWAEFEAAVRAEEEAVESATEREIEAYYSVAEARNKSSVNSYWKSNGLRESDIDSMYNSAMKNPDIYSNLDLIKAKYKELMDLQDRWKANGSDMTAPEVASITRLRQEVKSLIETEVRRHSAAQQEETDENKRQSLLKRGYALLKQIQRAETNWTKARTGKSAGEYANIQTYNLRLTELLRTAQAAKMAPEELSAKINQLNTEFMRSSAVIQANGDATKAWGERIGSLAAKFSTWFNLTRVIMGVVRTIRKMISTSIEISSALTQLRIVTNATDTEMEHFANTAITLSQKLGKSVTELVKPIETFSRLGYSLKDASALAEYATILSNVASVDIGEATTGLTSIVKGYNLDVSDAEHVADVLVEVGQKYAVSASEMMEAYEKSGAALHATNTSLEKSAGLIAAANASVQDSSVVGTALKTVSARIRGSKADLEELGEDTEELANGFSKYADEIKALTGFDIMVDENNFKDLYDIMEGISEVWDKLSDTQQARVAEILGGTRQLQVISSIIGNWKDAAGAYETAMNSAGASTKANDIYMEDISAHINQFKAAFEELSMTIMNSNMLKFFVDIGKGALSVITTLEKMHLLLPAIITSLIAIKGIKLGAQAVKTAANIGSLVTKIVNEKVVTDQLAVSVMGLTLKERQALATQIQAKVAAGALTEEEGKQILSTLGLATADGTLIVANKGLAASFKTVMASIPVWGWIALGVSLVIEAIGWFTNSVDQAEDKLQTAVDSLNETKSNIESVNSELETTRDRIDELNKKDKLTLVEQNELERLQKVNAELERKIELERAHKRAQSKTVLDQAMKDYEDLQQGGNDTGTVFAKAGGDIQGVSQIQAYLENPTEEAQQALEDYYQGLLKVKEALEDVDPDMLTPDARDALEYIRKFEDMYMVALGDAESVGVTFKNIFNNEQFKNGKDLFSQLKEEGKLTLEIVKAIFNYGKKGTILPDALSGFTDEQLKSARAMLEYLEDIGFIKYDDIESGLSGFIQQLNILGVETENAAKKQQQAVIDFEEVKSGLDKIRSAYTTLTSAIDEYNANGVISSETLSKILSLEPEYLNLLVDENGQLSLNAEGYEELIKAKMRNMIISKMQTTFDSILNMKVEEAQAYASAQAYNEETSSIYTLLGARARLSMQDALIKDQANNTDAYSKAIMRTVEAYSPLVNMVEDYDIAAENATKTTQNSTKATNEQKEALEAQKKALEDSKKALENYKTDLTNAQSAIKSLIDAVTDYIKQQKQEEKDALKERKEAFDEIIEAEQKELENKRAAKKLNDELLDKQNALAKSALAASVASLDDSSAGRKAQKAANDNLTDARKNLADTLADNEYDIRKNVLDELKKKNDEYYDAETKKIDDYLNNTRKLYEDACSLIENDTGSLHGELWNYTYKYTTKTKAEFDHMWGEAKDALDKYGVAQLGVIGVMEFLQGAIYNTESKIRNLEGEISNLSTAISNVSDSIDSMANNSLSNVAAKIANIRKEYQDLIDEMRKMNSAKWYYWWQGEKVESKFDDRDEAIHDIIHKIEAKYGGVFPGAAATVYGTIQHYASGTNSAAGGVSLVGENGAELRVLNRGDGIINNRITRGLANLGEESRFIIEAGKRLLSSLLPSGYGGSIQSISQKNSQPINVINHIQGDVNPSTLKALTDAEERIVGRAMKDLMSGTLQNRNNSRVR